MSDDHQKIDFPYTAQQLIEVMENVHHVSFRIPDDIRDLLLPEVAGVLADACREFHVNVNPGSAVGRAMTAAIGVALHVGMEMGHQLHDQFGAEPRP